jgi:ketopantoate reductase
MRFLIAGAGAVGGFVGARQRWSLQHHKPQG